MYKCYFVSFLSVGIQQHVLLHWIRIDQGLMATKWLFDISIVLELETHHKTHYSHA